MKKSIRIPSKLLSLFMAFLFVATTIPFAYAADPVTLTSSNVTIWPTVSGEISYGQKINEGVILSGGEIQYEGTVVPGHFEFVDPELRADMGIPNLKFVPDDTTSYSVSEIGYAWDLMFTINKTTPVFVDANSTPIATEVASAGTLLGNSKISGGQVMNPYYPEESTALGYTWSWVNRREPVTKSGYYEAQLGGGMYNTITTMIYVKIAGDTPETSIEEAPTFPRLEYNPDITWADIPLTGGKAVINGNEVVSGTFTISETWKDKVPTIGSYNVSVVFTPDDLSKASVYTMLIPVTVNKAPIRFVDENGNDIVPEITVPYGTKFSYVEQLLKPYIKGAEYTALIMGDLADKSCEEDGTYTISAYAPSDGDHYEKTELTFKIIIEKKKINPKLYSEPGKLYIEDTSGIYNPTGTFTLIYYIGSEKQGTIEGIKYLERFDWNPTKSGNYEYEIVYVEATENEHYIIDNFKANNALTLSWAFKATGMAAPASYQYGATVSYTAPVIDETMKDKPYYVFSEWSEVKGIEMTDEQKSNPEVSFTMPDNDVELKASYKFSLKTFFEWIWAKVVQFFTFIFNAVRDLFSLATA